MTDNQNVKDDNLNELRTRMNEEYFSLEQLLQNVNLAELVALAKDNSLQEWLENKFYNEQADSLNLDIIQKLDDDELRLEICETLEIDMMTLSDYDVRALERALEKRRKKSLFSEESEDYIAVESQPELMKALATSNKSVVYLCGGEFQIPLSKSHMTYIGRNNAVVDIVSKQPVNLDTQNISLKSLTVYLRYLEEDQITANESSNLTFVLGNRVALDPELTLNEINDFLQGRTTFETCEDFAKRSEKFSGVIIGETLLKEEDYNIDNHVFALKPTWRMNYLKTIKKFADNKYFSLIVAANVAKQLYDGRKLLIYADFGTDGSEAIIKNIFLMSDFGRIPIIVTNIPLINVIDLCGSGSGGLGYGLELINAYKDHKEQTAW
ncbi:MAG: hypothetical protein IJ862_03485 [Selenomonadaceae bacterium]|nr:hypothetical protein [Selenomonadaceae bacterium]